MGSDRVHRTSLDLPKDPSAQGGGSAALSSAVCGLVTAPRKPCTTKPVFVVPEILKRVRVPRCNNCKRLEKINIYNE